MSRIAIIGAGQLGGGLADCALRAGHAVTVCDLSSDVRARFAERGARIADHPADCAAAELVLIVVIDAAQVMDVIARPAGLAAGIRAGHKPAVGIVSTIAPEAVHAAAQVLAAAGARVMDTAITGGFTLVATGEGVFYVGGDSADIDRVEPLLLSLARAVYRCGPLGSGAVTKIVNNMVAITNLFVSAESYRLAQAYGMTAEDLSRAVRVGSGLTHWHKDAGNALTTYGVYASSAESMAKAVAESGEVLGLAQGLAEQAGLDLPFLTATLARLGTLEPEPLRQAWRSLVDDNGTAARPPG